MDNQTKKWVNLILLALIWGSSFILIKKSLLGLNPIQLGGMRIFFTAITLIIFGFKTLKTIKKKDWPWVILSGFMGSFFPAFLFAFAVSKIDSSIASILNSLVPLITIIIGFLVFHITIKKKQTIGVLIGLIGTTILILSGGKVNSDSNIMYNILVVIACICYGINLNVIKSKLQHIKPLAIATGNFSIIIIPTFIILVTSGVFSQETVSNPIFLESIGYVVLLSILGTAVAKILFNDLVQISSPVFSSSVTYLIPIVAVCWGISDGEQFNLNQIIGAFTILVGVYLVNAKKKVFKKTKKERLTD